MRLYLKYTARVSAVFYISRHNIGKYLRSITDIDTRINKALSEKVLRRCIKIEAGSKIEISEFAYDPDCGQPTPPFRIE